jgi:hypothetical protein
MYIRIENLIFVSFIKKIKLFKKQSISYSKEEIDNKKLILWLNFSIRTSSIRLLPMQV